MYQYILDNININSFVLEGRLVLFLRNTGRRALHVTLKAFFPISMNKSDWDSLLSKNDPLIDSLSSSEITEEGWGMIPVDSETISEIERNNLVRTKTWTLRLIRDEEICLPLERQVIRNEASNNPDKVFPLEFKASSQDGKTFSTLSLVQDQFSYDDVFDMTIKQKSLMAPFLILIEIETDQNPTLSAHVFYEQWAIDPN